MHSVQRSPEPEFLAELRSAYTNWDDLDGGDRRRIRDALFEDFGSTCAYCERRCEWPNRYRNSPNQETVDHFRPRYRFPALWLDWLNLVLVCHRCNQTKLGSWPEYDDQVNQVLADANPRYNPVSEYVSPNEEPGHRTAQEVFLLTLRPGEMTGAEQLDDKEWSIAHRTIWDINLNDRHLGRTIQAHVELASTSTGPAYREP